MTCNVFSGTLNPTQSFCAYLIYNHISLEISGSHSISIGDSYIVHYGNSMVSCTGNKKIRHFLTTINVRKNCLAEYFSL